MKYIKYFESNLNEDEIIEYLSDILLDIKDTGEWEYNVINMSDCYKIVLEPTIEYNHNEVGSKIDDLIIKAVDNCISYMSDDYEFEITTKQEDDEHEYSVDDIRELSNDSFVDEPLNYFTGDYIIIRFKK